MKRYSLYLIIIGVCILSSCNMQQRGSGALPKELVQAENIMYENPDSALHILQAMPIPSEKEAHATWALLLTQAKYKCFVDQSDSLVNIAHDYFMKGNNVHKKALSLFCKAALYEVNTQIEDALAYYLEAIKQLEFVNDNILKYLVYARVAFIYTNRELYDYASEYMKKANEYALLSQNYYYIVSSYNSIARLYSAKKNYALALEYYDKAIKLGENNNEVKLVNNALQEKIFILTKVKRYNEALLNTDILKKSSQVPQTHLVLGYFYTELNQPDSAYFYLNKASQSDNIYTQRSSYQALFNLSKKLKDYEKNSIYTIKLWNVQDSINKIDKKKILVEMQEKYNQQKIINEKNNAKKKGLIILCVSVAVIAIIVVLYQRKVLHKNEELKKKEKELTDFVNQLNENRQTIAQNTARIDELEGKEEISVEQQKEKQKLIEEMQKQNEKLENKNKNLQMKINEYAASMAEKSKELEGLRALSERNLYLHKRELFLCNELLKKEELIAKVKKNPKFLDAIQWQDIISRTNAIYDNYTIRLRSQIPELTENDIRICCLIKLSFSNGDIAKILGISSTSVSRQKLRLKERIIQQVGSLGSNVLLDLWLKEF